MTKLNDLVEVAAPLYLLRSRAACWRCGAVQEVIALACSRVVDNEEGEGGELGDESEPIVLINIQEMPTPILKQVVAAHPQFAKRYSQTAGISYYMNICECGAHFGDFFLHCDPDGAFCPCDEEAAALIVVEKLPFAGKFLFDCTYQFGTSAEYIFKYGRRGKGS